MSKSKITKFEKLTLRALEYVQKTEPNKVITTRNFQKIISKYCLDKNKTEMNWKETKFDTLTSYLKSLQDQDYISLNGTQISINNTTYRKPRKRTREEEEGTISTEEKKTELSSVQNPLFPSLISSLKSLTEPSIQKTNSLSTNILPKDNFSLLTIPNSQSVSIKRPKIRTSKAVIDLCEDLVSKSNTKQGIKCPVCNLVINQEKEINQHIDECLTLQLLEGETKPVSKIVKREEPIFLLSSDKVEFTIKDLEKDLESSLECSICFDPFRKDEEIAFLECMCFFHAKCFIPWFEKAKFCPLHMPNKIL